MIVENHDCEVGDGQSSILGRVGHTGTVDYSYQAEMWCEELFSHPKTNRVYVHSCGNALVVWGRGDNGRIQYVARSQAWRSEWELPAHFGDDTLDLAQMRIDDEDHTDSDKMTSVYTWAYQQLADPSVATAIALDGHGVVAAWEKGPEGIVQVAKSHRPLVTQQ